MTHSYKIHGMTCRGCLSTIHRALMEIPQVEEVQIHLESGFTKIRSSSLLNIETLSQAIAGNGKYSIQETSTIQEKKGTDKKAHKLYPLYLVFTYLIGMVLLSQIIAGSWDTQKAMQNFMGGFFILFSFFKMLDIKGFASAFSTYDPLSKRWKGYGYLYPFLEVIIGILFLTGVQLLWASVFTFIILMIGSIGVLESVLYKRSISCACLGTVFNLPMTHVTLLENALMLVMSSLIISEIL